MYILVYVLNIYRYWGWGGEDDDFYNRLNKKKLGPMQLSGKQGRYKVRISNIIGANTK
jgi:hypothetical protein